MMQIHPDVALLRGQGASQPACDAALAAWRALPQVIAVRAALAQLEQGAWIDDLPALARLVRDHAAATAFVAAFVAIMIEALRAEPLAHLPLGSSAAPGMARLRLIEQGRACLTLTALAPRSHRVSPSVLFEDAVVHEMVVAGTGEALAHRLAGAAVTTAALALGPGVDLARDGPATARQITAITRPLLLLQVSCEAAHPGPSREIAVETGRQITAISGCKQTSQQMMALGVIGALGHRAGITEMVGLARDGSRARDLRWEALRQVLALDAARGLGLLAALADAPADALAAPAAALQQQLRVARPDLAALMPEPA
jgi:hypothetical protein